jgi:hypothetical protein
VVHQRKSSRQDRSINRLREGKKSKPKKRAVNKHLKHMDVGSRNARLCAMLQSMGLFVLPVFAEDDSERIDYMQVSVDLPSRASQNGSQQTSCRPVAAPMSGAEVVVRVGASESDGNNVVDFPSILGKLSVLAPANEPHVTIHADIGLPNNRSGF